MKLLKRFFLPTVIAPLSIGLILNYLIYSQGIFWPEFGEIISSFAILGVILLLFLLGLKINLHFIKKLSKNSSVMAINAGLVPFLLGFFAAAITGFDAFQSIFVGICLSITSEEVALSILKELNLIKKRLGRLVIEAGILGDVFEIHIIAILGIIMKAVSLGTGVDWFRISAELVLFAAAIIFIRYFVVPFIFNLVGKEALHHELLLGSLFILFVTTLVSQWLNFGYFIGALTSGILIKDKLIEKKEYGHEHQIISVVETISFGFFEPLVFIWIGLSIDINILLAAPWFGIMLTAIALLGKLVGAILGNYFCGESIKEGYMIGWALNSRGSTELFAIIIAKNQNIINPTIFNGIVFMAIATTLISPIVFKFLMNSRFTNTLKEA
jgi:Kef-type K+ transport system membrane component KefB